MVLPIEASFRRVKVGRILACLPVAVIVLTLNLRVWAQSGVDVRWEKVELRSGEVAEIAIAPSNPNIMYAGFEVNSHSLYKSEDGGKSWRRVEGGGDHAKDVAVSPQDPHRVYLAMSHPLETTDLSFRSSARSLYGGGPPGAMRETQTILTTGVPAGGASVSLSSVEVAESDDRILYAARRGGPYGPGGAVRPKIYRSLNRGQTWTETDVDLPEVNVVAIGPQNPDLIFIGSRDGIFKSEDAGKTLAKLSSQRHVISIEFQISAPDIVYAAADAQVLKSTDGGGSWQDITGQLKDIHRVRVSRSHPNILYASTFEGVFRSDNGGVSWRDISGNLKARNIQIVEIHPNNPDIAFIGHSSLWSSVRSEDRYRTGLLAEQGIFKTEDGGKMWVRADNGIEEYRFEEVAVNPNKAYEAWVASPASRGGYKTEDAGQSFRLSQTPTFHYPMRIKYSLENPEKIIASGWQNNAPFSVSQDGGVNWELVSERIFFAGLNRGKEMLSDRIEAIHIHGIAIDPTNDLVMYAGSVHDTQNPAGLMKGAHFFKSVDGGKTWTESDEGFPHEQKIAIHDVVVDPQDTSVIYLATTKHESEKGVGVYKSTDGGTSWRQVSRGLTGEGLSVNTLQVQPQNTSQLVIATFGGLYTSADGGLTWQKTSGSRSFDVEYVSDEPSTVYASTDDGVLVSADFGTTWKPFGFGLPQGKGQGIGVDKTGTVVYAAVENKGLFVARLTDIPAQDQVSEWGQNPYGFGPFGPGGWGRFGLFAGGPRFLMILLGVTGVLVGLPLAILALVRWRRRG